MNWINRKGCKNVRLVKTSRGMVVAKREPNKPATFVTDKYKFKNNPKSHKYIIREISEGKTIEFTRGTTGLRKLKELSWETPKDI